MIYLLGQKNILGIFDDDIFNSIHNKIKNSSISFEYFNCQNVEKEHLVVYKENNNIKFFFVDNINEILSYFSDKQLISCEIKEMVFRSSTHSLLICKIYDVPKDITTCNNILLNFIGEI